MKKIAHTLLVVMLVFTAAFTASAQSEESRPVSGFNRIASGGPFNVHVKINGTESLRISSRADIIKLIETVVEDGTLKIKFRDHLRDGEGDSDGPIDIYVTAKSLSSLANAGSGSIKVDGTVTGSNVSVVLSGSGDIESAVRSENLRATISGSGSIKLNGSADEAKVVISGSGEMNGHDLKTKDATVTITGSGNAYFSADKTVSARIVGSGNVVYSGNATITDSRTVGSGSVSKAD